MINPEITVVDNGYHYPEIIGETVERWNATPTTELLDGVKDEIDDNGTRMLVAHPHTNTSPEEAIEKTGLVVVQDLPFANGAFPWKRLSTQFLADVTGNTVVSIAAPGTDGSRYKFSMREARDIARRGDFSPYTRKGLEAIDKLYPVVGTIATIGWSQGGSLALDRAANALDEFDVKAAAAGDPSNTIRRRRPRLFGDLGKAGYDKLGAELDQADIEAFREVFGYSGDNLLTDKQRGKHYAKSMVASSLNNYRLAGGLGRPTAATTVSGLLREGVDVTLAYGGDSAIMTAAMTEGVLSDIEMNLSHAHEDIIGELTLMLFANTTHAGGDNMVKYGSMALASLK